MKKIYGSLIFFFYFIKYPVIIYLLINYFYLKLENSLIINILGLISLVLILKDLFFPYKKPDNCSGVKKWYIINFQFLIIRKPFFTVIF